MGQKPNELSRSADIEATILVKALPQVSESHGETVELINAWGFGSTSRKSTIRTAASWW